MKKIIYVVFSLFALVGCGMMNNTPTKKVEALLNKYQTNDNDVISDLDNVLLMDSNFTDDERNDYKEFMKKHYQDMTYKIKNESIDGDSATVEAEITVRNYANTVNEANDYRLNNSSEFDDTNTFASYRLKELKKVKDTEKYTIIFTLTKTDDEWQINPLSIDDENKLNGLYGVNDINIETDTTENSSQNNEANDNGTNENQDTNQNNNSSIEDNNRSE